MLVLVAEAVHNGCRKKKACEALGLSLRTVQRWERGGATERRGSRAKPANALSETEKEEIMSIMNQPVYRDKTPHQIVPQLADEGRYLASESTMTVCSGNSTTGAPPAVGAGASVREVAAGRATTERSVELGHYQGPVRGMFFYLYLMVDQSQDCRVFCMRKKVCRRPGDEHLEQVTPGRGGPACRQRLTDERLDYARHLTRSGSCPLHSRDRGSVTTTRILKRCFEPLNGSDRNDPERGLRGSGCSADMG